MPPRPCGTVPVRCSGRLEDARAALRDFGAKPATGDPQAADVVGHGGRLTAGEGASLVGVQPQLAVRHRLFRVDEYVVLLGVSK